MNPSTLNPSVPEEMSGDPLVAIFFGQDHDISPDRYLDLQNQIADKTEQYIKSTVKFWNNILYHSSTPLIKKKDFMRLYAPYTYKGIIKLLANDIQNIKGIENINTCRFEAESRLLPYTPLALMPYSVTDIWEMKIILIESLKEGNRYGRNYLWYHFRDDYFGRSIISIRNSHILKLYKNLAELKGD